MKYFLCAVLLFGSFSLFAGDSIPEKSFRHIHKPPPVFRTRLYPVVNYLLFMRSENPAFAGISKNHLFTFGDVRYPGQKHFPLTIMAGYDQQIGRKDTSKVHRGTHSLGYWGGYDRSGSRWSMRHILNYSYRHQFSSRVVLRVGAGVGYDYTEYDVRSMTYGDMIDERYGYIYSTNEVFSGTLSKPNMILNGGMSLYLYRLTVNFNVNSTLSFSDGIIAGNKRVNAFTRYNGSAWYNFMLTRKWSIYPVAEFSVIDRDWYTAEGGVYIHSLHRHGMIGGLAYNTNNILSLTAGYLVLRKFNFTGKVYFPFSDLSMLYPSSGFLVQVHFTL